MALAQAVVAAVVISCVAAASPGWAMCPQELAVYSQGDGQASVEFQPRDGAAVSNRFRVLLDTEAVLDGVVMWSDDVPRPNGRLMHQCPEGDVTGAEIEACTVWQGVIYAVDADGKIALLPVEGEDAAEQLLLPDFAWALKNAPALAGAELSPLDTDVFRLSGCQE